MVDDPIAIVRRHGVMLESARGAAPSFASAIAGEPVTGNWWAHSASHEIYAATRAVRDSGEVLVCRLIGSKVTYVHADLWPALVRLADRVDRARLDWIHEEHAEGGRHRVEVERFPDWVPPAIARAAKALSEEDAMAALGAIPGLARMFVK
jgi:hypothetical protein